MSESSRRREESSAQLSFFFFHKTGFVQLISQLLTPCAVDTSEGNSSVWSIVLQTACAANNDTPASCSCTPHSL
jgi:hypothetical protein